MAETTVPLGGLDNRPMSPRQRYAAMLVAFGEFIDGYDLIVMGAALILLRPQFHLSPAETGALGASTFLGAMLACWCSATCPTGWGRRAIFVANLLFFVVFSIASAFVDRCRSFSSRVSWWVSASAWISRPAPPTWPRSRRVTAAASSPAHCSI